MTSAVYLILSLITFVVGALEAVLEVGGWSLELWSILNTEGMVWYGRMVDKVEISSRDYHLDTR